MSKYNLEIANRTQVFVPKKLLEQIYKKALLLFGKFDKKQNFILSLAVISDRTMTQINKKYRGKDKTTNELSFTYHKPKKQSKNTIEPVYLGEILISAKQAQKGAKGYKHTLGTEIALLFIHGLLHILSFKHENNPKAAKKMQHAEKTLITKIPQLQRVLKKQGGILER